MHISNVKMSLSAAEQAREARAAAAAAAELRGERQRADALEAERNSLLAQNAELQAENERLRKLVEWVRED